MEIPSTRDTSRKLVMTNRPMRLALSLSTTLVNGLSEHSRHHLGLKPSTFLDNHKWSDAADRKPMFKKVPRERAAEASR